VVEFCTADLRRIKKEVEGKDLPQYISPADAAELERQAANNEQEAMQGEPKEQPSKDDITSDPQKGFWDLPTREEFNRNMRIDSGVARPREADTEARKAWELEQTEKHFTGDKPPKLEEMDPVFVEALERSAEALGMGLEEFTDQFWEHLNAPAKDPEGAPQSETTEGNVIQGSFTQGIGEAIDEAVIEGQTRTASAGGNIETRKASPVLDLLGHTEGTDKGRGYNETLAYGALTGGDMDLVNMTLGEIDKLQTQMLRHPDNKWNSSAVGRYQIVRKTMRGLKRQMGLSDDTKFTPELQDKMAMALLRGRGYDKWLAGQKSDTSFLNSMAREWASVPTSKGTGYYDGQRTGTSVAGVMSAFDFVRNDKVGLSFGHTEDDGHDHSHDFEFDHGTPSGDLGKLLTASDRGYDPDMDNVQDDVKTRLVALQKAFGKQLPVVSGYRDPERNKRGGGAKKSQHMHGNAVDISVRDMPIEERKRLIRMASEAGFTGIGVYANSLHFDIGGRRYWGPSHSGSSLPSWASGVIAEHMKRTS